MSFERTSNDLGIRKSMGEVLEAASSHLLCGGIVAKNFMGEHSLMGEYLERTHFDVAKSAPWPSFCLTFVSEDYFSLTTALECRP